MKRSAYEMGVLYSGENKILFAKKKMTDTFIKVLE